MPINYKNYHPDFKNASEFVRFVRANGQCECEGECGRHKTRCRKRNGEPLDKGGVVVLTAAHLDYDGGVCTCKKDTGIKCADPSHLKAMCQGCHLIMDLPHHIANARETRTKKKDSQRGLLI